MSVDFPPRKSALKQDASYGQRVASYLTDEQQAEGPEGDIIRSEVEDGELIYYVNLENVPIESRHPASDCHCLYE